MSIKEVVERIIEYFEKNGFKYKIEDESTIITAFPVDNKLGNIKEIINVTDNSYCVMAKCPLYAEKDYRSCVAELMTRINYGLRFGNFEMDFSDGEILFRLTKSTFNGLPTDEDIEHSIFLPMSMYSLYGNGFAELIFTDKSPEEIINGIKELEVPESK